jgi:hypothetical protein
VRHAIGIGGGDIALCGLADDVNAVEEDIENPIYAEVGQIVTCPDCQAIIVYCKESFSGRQRIVVTKDSLRLK